MDWNDGIFVSVDDKTFMISIDNTISRVVNINDLDVSNS